MITKLGREVTVGAVSNISGYALPGHQSDDNDTVGTVVPRASLHDGQVLLCQGGTTDHLIGEKYKELALFLF